jgi:hypothetical protein
MRLGDHLERDGMLVKWKGNGDTVPSMMVTAATRTRRLRIILAETEHQTEIDKVYEHQEHKVIPKQQRDEPMAHQSSVSLVRLYISGNGVCHGRIGAHGQL